MALGKNAFQVDFGPTFKDAFLHQTVNYTAKEKCLIMGREISRIIGWGSVAVMAVSFIAGMIFGVIAVATAYILVTGFAGLALLSISGMALATAIVSEVVFDILDDKIKKIAS